MKNSPLNINTNINRNLIAALLLVLSCAGSTIEVDPDLYSYQPSANPVDGKVTSVGSDTLNNLMTFWTEAFRSTYPSVTTEVQGAGSSTAPPALTEGVSTLGPMSREMKAKELAAFEEVYGYKPTPIPVAIDALAVFVNKRNKIKGLTMQEVDAIFSTTRRCGLRGAIDQWGDLQSDGRPVAKRLRRQNIALYGRNSVSGTYGYFKKVALCKGDYKSSVNEQPGSSAVVQSVGKQLSAIGYSGIGYSTSRVRAVPIAYESGGEYIEASFANAGKGTYPLSRYLYVYVNWPPGSKLPRKEREFLKMALSKQGQELVLKGGYVPLPANIANSFADKL